MEETNKQKHHMRQQKGKCSVEGEVNSTGFPGNSSLIPEALRTGFQSLVELEGERPGNTQNF